MLIFRERFLSLRDEKSESAKMPSFKPLPSARPHKADGAPGSGGRRVIILLSAVTFLAGMGTGSVVTLYVGPTHMRALTVSSQSRAGGAPADEAAETIPTDQRAASFGQRWLTVPHVSGRADLAMPLEARTERDDRSGRRAIVLSGLEPDVELSAGHDAGRGTWTVDADQLSGLRWDLKPISQAAPPPATGNSVAGNGDADPGTASADMLPKRSPVASPASVATPSPDTPGPPAAATSLATAEPPAADRIAQSASPIDAIAKQVRDLVARADRQIAEKSLATPQGDNALETYQELVALAPNDPAGPQLLDRIKQTYLLWARAAEKHGQTEDARHLTERALSVDRRFRRSSRDNRAE
jgi:hypothetical protein